MRSDIKEKFKARLQIHIDYYEEGDEDKDLVSWNLQEGILISCNEAKFLLQSISKPTSLVTDSEVSDENINNEIKSRYKGSIDLEIGSNPEQQKGFRKGAKWMREARKKLNNK